MRTGKRTKTHKIKSYFPKFLLFLPSSLDRVRTPTTQLQGHLLIHIDKSSDDLNVQTPKPPSKKSSYIPRQSCTSDFVSSPHLSFLPAPVPGLSFCVQDFYIQLPPLVNFFLCRSFRVSFGPLPLQCWPPYSKSRPLTVVEYGGVTVRRVSVSPQRPRSVWVCFRLPADTGIVLVTDHPDSQCRTTDTPSSQPLTSLEEWTNHDFSSSLYTVSPF